MTVVWPGQSVKPLAVGPGLNPRASTVFLEPILFEGIPCSAKYSGEGLGLTSK